MAYREVTEQHSPNQGRTDWNANDQELFGRVDTLEGGAGSAVGLANETRNVTFSGGGTIAWNLGGNGKLSWTARFVLLPTTGGTGGISTHPERYVALPMPQSGVLDHNGNERADAGGISLAPFETLWAVHVRGSGPTAGNSWRVIHYQNALMDSFFASDNAYLIAVRTDESNLMLRNGNILAPGQTIVSGGIRDHGSQAGLGDDDHPQYYNEVRGDERFARLGFPNVFQSSLSALGVGVRGAEGETVQGGALTIHGAGLNPAWIVDARADVLRISVGGTVVVEVDDNGAADSLRMLGNRVWHAGNDGAGSGADADSVDGEHLAALQTRAEKGTAGGYAPLDAATGRVPVGFLPDTITGALDYQGPWNAATNTPTLTNAYAGSKGDLYVVSVAGNTPLGQGTSAKSDWGPKDWVVWNGSSWDYIENTDSVTSVFGRVGLVVAQDADYAASQVVFVPYSTITATRVNMAIQQLADQKLAASHAGTRDGHPTATTTLNGLMLGTDKAKLDGVEANATADQTPAEIRAALKGGDNPSATAALSTYDVGVSYHFADSTQTGWPSAATGTAFHVLTLRRDGTSGTQEARDTTDARMWRRHWSSAGGAPAWSAWKRTTALDLLGSGTPDATTFLNGAGEWALPPGATEATREQVFTRSGSLSTGRVKARWQVPSPGVQIVGVLATVDTPTQTSALILDLVRATTQAPAAFASVYTTQANRPTIAVGAYATVAPLPDVVDLTEGDHLCMEIDQVGAGAGLGADVTMQVRYLPAG